MKDNFSPAFRMLVAEVQDRMKYSEEKAIECAEYWQDLAMLEYKRLFGEV